MEYEISSPDFWQFKDEKERQEADLKLKEFGELKNFLEEFNQILKDIEFLKNKLLEKKEHFSKEDEEKILEIKKRLRVFELRQIFKGKYDKNNALISIYPGAGGEDAEDWARMLFLMYQKYATRRNWQFKILEDGARLKTLEINGAYAYGYLKYESGVHRLVRISPFSPQKLRHTSFALVEVLPVLEDVDASLIQIPEKDLKFEFKRSGGPGGQNVNKVETAVRIVHIPTGISASCETERSQARNREKAEIMLKAKLLKLMEKERVEEISKLRVKVKPEWGNQIRSYVLNPYKLVKDHRTNIETSNVESVLEEGDLDAFIEGEIELLEGKN